VKKRQTSKARPGSSAERMVHAAPAGRLPVGLSWRQRSPAVRHAVAYGADERQMVSLLLLPLLIFTVFLGLNRSLQPTAQLIEIAARGREPTVAVTVPTELPVVIASVAAPAAKSFSPLPMTGPPMSRPGHAVEIAPLQAFPAPLPVPVEPLPQVASLNVPLPPVVQPQAPPLPVAIAPPVPPQVCEPVSKRAALTTPPAVGEFGIKLAEAAHAQTGDFVIYSATYRRIAYPGGDIPSLYGSCSDVVIRAYRALGVDLQELVQRARVGRGDPNIDHRRTETLRAFFNRYGTTLQPSPFGEDYKPGDIVTYYRPFSRISRAHIAIVSATLGASGRPMIIHNRGWGPQVEDALFVDRITGHYRFTSAPHLLVPAARIVRPAAPVAASASEPLPRKKPMVTAQPVKTVSAPTRVR
jgi:uncharacterized protein YijF (DUF1287 family)